MSSLGFTSFAPQKASSSPSALVPQVLPVADPSSESALVPQIHAPVAVTTPYTAAVVYLLTTLPLQRPKQSIFRSLSLVQRNFPWRYQWPILLFHAGVYDADEAQEAFLAQLRVSAEQYDVSAEEAEKLLKRIQFVHLQHNVPAGIPPNPKEYKPVWEGMWPGYHHMCAFFSYKIFRHPRIKDLTYYLRLDDDSFIREPVCFDPIEYMHVKNQSFAFRFQDTDWQGVTAGMWPLVSDYAQSHPEVEDRMLANHWPWAPKRFQPDYGKGVGFPGYNGNLELVRLARFQTPEVKEFLDELESNPAGFYHERWGDAPLRKATVYMFLNVTEEVHLMCEIEYAHKQQNYTGCGCTPLPTTSLASQ
ncbi:glycolipid 2-alpha-mannosyltransferase-domain-containing protein [Mycena filopes]|nr:glycolipid 2-alpha-mannosyltransferase-domain-containing protein [Mycena filopes]